MNEWTLALSAAAFEMCIRDSFKSFYAFVVWVTVWVRRLTHILTHT